jgi:prepilin peptidase CpaA
VVFGLSAGIVLSAYQGPRFVLLSALGFITGVGLLIVPFAFGWIGAGDVKYLGVIGMLLGVGMLPRVFFYSALVAGLITVLYFVMGVFHATGFRQQWNEFKTVILSMGRILPEPVVIQSRRQGGSVPWGVAFAIGTVFAYYFDNQGRWAGF